MKKLKKIISAVLAVMMLASCVAFSASAEEDLSLLGKQGTFDIININIAGLPIPSSETEDGRDALADNVEMATLLNKMGFDIITVQEDFNYDIYFRELLTNYSNVTDDQGNVTERHQTVHAGGVPMGDGLNMFTKNAQFNEVRKSWKESAGILDDGSDELTYKGFAVTTIKLEEGYYLDIYNIHADAYGGAASIKAKEAQFAQLAEYVKKHSVFDENTLTYDHAVIITGDFNQSICDEEVGGKLVANLLEECYLNDAWAVQTISEITENPADYDAYYTYANETNLGYNQTQGLYDSVERIVFADGNGLDLTLDVFAYMQILGADKEPLSDHSAATAIFNYEIVEKVQDTGINHDKETVQQEKGMLFRFLEYIASIFRAFGLLIKGLGSGITF